MKRINSTASIGNDTRSIVIVTTAASPWLTGTAVNPALRAAYLSRKGHKVTLVVPWLPVEEQPLLFPDGVTFDNQQQQRSHILSGLRKRTSFEPRIDVQFYTGRYDKLFCSIIPVGDLTEFVIGEPDLVLLEEPEHLTWYHHGPRWASRFNLVVGIMHTNYIDYVRREAGEAPARALSRLNRFLCNAHCHKVIKLSDAVQTLPREETVFVHGVSSGFLEVGRARAKAGAAVAHDGTAAAEPAAEEGDGRAVAEEGDGRAVAEEGDNRAVAEQGNGKEEDGSRGDGAGVGGGAGGGSTRGQEEGGESGNAEVCGEGGGSKRFSKGAYFLGKVLWAKGYRELLDMLSHYKQRAAEASKQEGEEEGAEGSGQPQQQQQHVDLYGKGDHLQEVKDEAARLELDVTFYGARDHLDSSLHEYRVFINPSTSDVVATTSAEALAMGKWLVCARHPCNEFFSTFRNCLIYETPDQFVEKLDYALAHDPHPLSDDDQRRLSWDDATERMLVAAFTPVAAEPAPRKLGAAIHEVTWKAYNSLLGIEFVRRAVGAGRNTKAAPLFGEQEEAERMHSMELYPQGCY